RLPSMLGRRVGELDRRLTESRLEDRMNLRADRFASVEIGNMRLVTRAAMLGFVIAGSAYSGEMRNVNGCVVDETGMPVAHADVAFYWTANGPLNDPSGKPYEFDTVEGRRALSDNLGKMFPLGDIERPTKTGPDGRFSMSVPGDRHHLLAIDD